MLSQASFGLRFRLAVVGFVLALGFWTLASTASISKSAALHTAPVAIERQGARSRVVLVFIDSLSRDIATSAQRMPTLARLAGEGASFEVEPCRDQLTYLCLRAPGSLLAAALLLLDHLYGADASHVAPIEIVLAATAAALLAWQRMRLPSVTAQAAAGATVAVSLYLMFWPTVGFHLVGIDFTYMFQWVPAESYERAWYVIALGVIVKLALPLTLVVAVAREHLRERTTVLVALLMLSGKVALLSVMIAGYALWHDLTSQVALAMLAELALLMFGVCAAVAALPSTRSVVEAGASELLPAPRICLHANSVRARTSTHRL